MLSCTKKVFNYQFHRNLNVSKRNVHTKFAIVGGGTAGMNVCAQLLHEQVATPSDITVFDASPIHYYQPGFTMISGGVLGNNNTLVKQQLGGLVQKPMQQLFNSNINLIHDSIGEYLPNQNKLYTYHNNNEYSYDILIMCSGIETRYDLIEGLQDALDDPEHPCGSMYSLKYALKINKLRSEFKGGKVIATQPPMPIKCGGAPQKWLYLTEYEFRKQGIKNDIESFKFYTQLHTMFAVKKYDNELKMFMKQKDIEPVYQTELIKVDKNNNLAHFKDINGNIIIEKYDLLHVVPLQKSNRITASADFSNSAGFVDVDNHTLQSKKYDNIFGIGDCLSVPCAKTAAAVFSQTPTVVNNIKLYLNKQQLIPSFDGYSSCPLFIGDKKLMLAEFIYGNKRHETFNLIGLDQTTPHKAFYYLKRYFFPFVYWNFAPLGMWHGNSAFWKKKFKPV